MQRYILEYSSINHFLFIFKHDLKDSEEEERRVSKRVTRSLSTLKKRIEAFNPDDKFPEILEETLKNTTIRENCKNCQSGCDTNRCICFKNKKKCTGNCSCKNCGNT